MVFIISAVNGYSTVIVGYGQTGSGKSFTMNGLYYNYQKRGLGARLISSILTAKRELQNKYLLECYISYCEIHGNKIYDLLDENFNTFIIGNAKIDNLQTVEIVNEEQALSLLFEGEGKRLVNKQVQKRFSHLGTSVLTIQLTSTITERSGCQPNTAKIQVIDLAGVDSIGSPCSTGKKNIDISCANKNMLFLEIYLKYIANKSKIDQKGSIIRSTRRISPLVNYLADTLNGKCFLRFICHINTDEKSLPMTLSMLRYIPVFKSVKAELVIPTAQNSPEMEISLMKDKLNECMQNVIRRATFSDEDLDHFICKTRLEHMNRVAEEFLENKIDNISVLNTSHALTVINMMKDKYMDLQKENLKLQEMKTNNKDISISSAAQQKLSEAPPSLVGEITYKGKSIGPETVDEFDYNFEHSKKSTPSIGYKRTQSYAPQFSDLAAEKEMAWNNFLLHENTKTLQKQFEVLDHSLNKNFEAYKDETSQLYSLRTELEKTKMKLTEAQMKRRLTHVDEYNDDGFIIPTSEEKRCVGWLREVEALVKEKEKIVKRLKQEFTETSRRLRETKDTIEEAFTQYCNEHHKNVVGTFDTLDTRHEQTSRQGDYTEEVLFFQRQYDRQYKKLQKIMYNCAKSREEYEFYHKRRWSTAIQ